MTQEPADQIPGGRLATPKAARRINTGRLWAGGLATAVVTALIVVVGVLAARQILGSAALATTTIHGYAAGTFAKYALLAAAAALLATILMNLLLLAVPQPARFFSWIVGLLTAVGAILPFTMAGPTGPTVASALINLLVGIAILALLGSIAAGCVRRTARPGNPGGLGRSGDLGAPTIIRP
jgi:uncharacterized membrane protein YhaH (DUF805 family)